MRRTTIAMIMLGAGLAGCGAPDGLPLGAALPGTPAAAPAAGAPPERGAAAPAPALDVGATVAQTVDRLREQKTSAFELALFRMELLDAPRLKATLLERHVLRPHPQAMGAYTFNETGEVRVRLDDDWPQALAAGRPFIVVRVEFGVFEEAATPKALEDAKRRAAEAVGYLRSGLTGGNGCAPWEITANGLSQGSCTYHVLEQRFFPQTKSGYAPPMDPARMHAVANIARAFRLEATVGFRTAGRDTKHVICSGPITADETRCALVDVAPR
jgi:hypothetical protein